MNRTFRVVWNGSLGVWQAVSELTMSAVKGAAAGGKRQISTAGGDLPRWRSDGREIFYVSQESRIMAAEVAAKGDSFEVGKVSTLFSLPAGISVSAYDVMADGQHFLIPIGGEDKSAGMLTLIHNWAAGPKK